MNRTFGIASYPDNRNEDDGSDEFIIEKYRQQISDEQSNDEVLGIGDFYSVEIVHPVPQPQQDEIGRDKPEADLDTHQMNDITREELDAKLATIEARADARLADYQRISSEILSGFRSDNAEFKARIDQSLSDIKLEIHSVKNIKTLLGAATAVIVGTIFAAFALSGQFFDSGRDTAQLVQEAKQQTSETRHLLEQIQAQQRATEAPSPTGSK